MCVVIDPVTYLFNLTSVDGHKSSFDDAANGDLNEKASKLQLLERKSFLLRDFTKSACRDLKTYLVKGLDIFLSLEKHKLLTNTSSNQRINSWSRVRLLLVIPLVGTG